MASNQRAKVAYGLSQPYFAVGPIPVETQRDPVYSDYADIGALWVNTATNTAWILTSVVANAATWTQITP